MKPLQLEINGTLYDFTANFAFLREINKEVRVSVDENVKKDVGLSYQVSFMLAGDMEALVTVLMAMNAGKKPRVKKEDLEKYIVDVEDIESLVDSVLDFLSNANVSHTIISKMLLEVGYIPMKNRAPQEA